MSIHVGDDGTDEFVRQVGGSALPPLLETEFGFPKTRTIYGTSSSGYPLIEEARRKGIMDQPANPRSPIPDPWSWSDPRFQERLRKRLLAVYRPNPCGEDPADLVQETLLRMHVRVVATAQPIREPTGLALKILRGVQVDLLRRKPRFMSQCESPDVIPAIDKEIDEESDVFSAPQVADLRSLFPGKVQRAILEGLIRGSSTHALAEALRLQVADLHKVMAAMARKLWDSN